MIYLIVLFSARIKSGNNRINGMKSRHLILSQDVKINFYCTINKSICCAAVDEWWGTERDGRSAVLSSICCRTQFFIFDRMRWINGEGSDYVRRTMRVICCVKVKRRMRRRERTGRAFSSLTAWSFWGWSSRSGPRRVWLSWGSSNFHHRSAEFSPRSSAYVDMCDSRTEKSPQILDAKNRSLTDEKGARDPAPWSFGKRLAQCRVRSPIKRQIRRRLFSCLISASGWRVRRGPLRTSGSAGSDAGI